MERKNIFAIWVLSGIFLLLGLPALADFNAGHNAYISEDFETAFQEWAPLAKSGDADAQNMLCLLYTSPSPRDRG